MNSNLIPRCHIPEHRTTIILPRSRNNHPNPNHRNNHIHHHLSSKGKTIQQIHNRRTRNRNNLNTASSSVTPIYRLPINKNPLLNRRHKKPQHNRKSNRTPVILILRIHLPKKDGGRKLHRKIKNKTTA